MGTIGSQSLGVQEENRGKGIKGSVGKPWKHLPTTACSGTWTFPRFFGEFTHWEFPFLGAPGARGPSRLRWLCQERLRKESLGCVPGMWGANVGTLEMGLEGCSLCCCSFVLLFIEVGLDQVLFKCPLQPKAPWHSVVLGSLGMGFFVFLTFLSCPGHPREGAPQGWSRDQAGLGAQRVWTCWGDLGWMPPKPLRSLCRTGRGNKKDPGADKKGGTDPSSIPSRTQQTELGGIV